MKTVAQLSLPTSTVASVLCAFLFCLGAVAEEDKGGGFDYANYAAVLKAYVSDQGMVYYRGLKARPEKLNAFLAQLRQLKKDEYDTWNKEEKIAFWINAYNALTLKAIISNYPIKSSWTKSLKYPKNSIRQISGVWDKLKFSVRGRRRTLNEIEHGMLRKYFDEPRIHMALVWAAMGCPALRNEPYIGDKLDDQLHDQTQRFLKNRKKFRIDRRGDRVYLSPIFKWFGEDFIKKYGTTKKFTRHKRAERAVLNFVSKYLDEDDTDYLLRKRYSVKYLDYDWSLNERSRTVQP